MVIISLPVVLIWIPVEIETRILNLFSFLIKPKNAQKPVDREVEKYRAMVFFREFISQTQEDKLFTKR